MSLFGNFFAKPRAESVVLINIGAGGVSGAYAHYKDRELPTLLYAKSIPVELHEGEPPETGMERALETLTNLLLVEGAPALHRVTGSGTADTILVAIDAPWQSTSMRVDKIEPGHSFTFTQRLVNQQLASESTPPPGELLVDESLVGTILNGYETREPFGKRVERASIIILVSSIVQQVAETIALVLRRSYHTKNILLIAGASMRYQAVRAAFPLERDCLILDATGPEVALALVRHGLLVAVNDAPDGKAGEGAWSTEVRAGLAELAKSYPLPQVIFLIAKEPDLQKLSTILTSGNLGELWLSENPPKVIALGAQHITGLVKTNGDVSATLTLALLALYAKIGLNGERAPEK